MLRAESADDIESGTVDERIECVAAVSRERGGMPQQGDATTLQWLSLRPILNEFVDP
jgi:hypothetical protein